MGQYTVDHKKEWDTFAGAAKNATFLFFRDYMDYHRERFTDHSLMVYRGNELLAVLPANLDASGTLISHEGLTYGGLLVSRTAKLHDVLACFYASLRFLCDCQITRLVYKRIPSFYTTLPDDDVAYALFLLDAHLYRRDCSLVVNQADRLHFRKGRRSEIKKARRLGVRVAREMNLAPFWERVLIPRLAGRYRVSPVHTVEEITLLASRFPEHIKQFSAYLGDEIVAGATIYETPNVAHVQYIGVSETGRKVGALDYLFGWLIDEYYVTKHFFDFGTCSEDEGRAVNYGLLNWKEGFGARCYAHDFFELATTSYVKLEPLLHSDLKIVRPTPTPNSVPPFER